MRESKDKLDPTRTDWNPVFTVPTPVSCRRCWCPLSLRLEISEALEKPEMEVKMKQVQAWLPLLDVEGSLVARAQPAELDISSPYANMREGDSGHQASG